MGDSYTFDERRRLLALARETLEHVLTGGGLIQPDLEALPPALREPRACFVTYHTLAGDLRGCTGVLEARQPLAHEVVQMAVQTALNDPRFPPLTAAELDGIVIELSLLTPPEPLAFDDPADIPARLQPGRDGVLLRIGAQRATFLPQVWERYPDPEAFLDLLCQKMGQPPQCWRQRDVRVDTYRSITFEETAPGVFAPPAAAAD